MKILDRMKLLFLGTLVKIGVIDIKRLKFSPDMVYEFTIEGLGTILTNLIKRISEVMPKDNIIITRGARDAGRDFVLVLRAHGLVDSVDTVDKAILLLMSCLRMEHVQKRLNEKEYAYHVVKCPFLKTILKEGVPEVCMMCQGLYQGIANVMAKNCTVEIPKKMSEKSKYCEFVIKGELASRKGLLPKGKLEIPSDAANEIAVREIGMVLVKIGERVKKTVTPKVYKTMLFWGARDAGREVGKMIKRFGIKDGLNAVEAVTTFFGQFTETKSVRIKLTEREYITRIFECPFLKTILKEKFPEVCTVCKGFCQGMADVIVEGCVLHYPKRMSEGDEYCEFVYKVK